MGSVLELARPGRPPFRVYVSGDTLFFPWLASIVERTGPLDAAVVHLGGTRLAGLLVTMDDRQGADLVGLLEPQVVVPVHHDDYGVFRSPLADFVATFERRQLPGALPPGGSRRDGQPRALSPQVAGPSRTAPSGPNREPCSGQSQLRSASFQRTTPPRWVQTAETCRSAPWSREVAVGGPTRS